MPHGDTVCNCDPSKCDGPVLPPDYIVHATCRPRDGWCEHLHIHMPPTLPRPLVHEPRKQRRERERGMEKWQRQHPADVIWAMRVVPSSSTSDEGGDEE